jgi:long-subunit fatty acid transport protein
MMSASVPTGKKDKPNTFGWLQLEKKSASELKRLAITSPIAMASLMYMVERMSRSNALVVGQRAIAQDLGKTERSISTALALLEKHNFIERIKVGTGCAYRVNTRVFWQGVRGARFAYFSAEVIALESEQTMSVDNRTPLKIVPKRSSQVEQNPHNEDSQVEAQQEIFLE